MKKLPLASLTMLMLTTGMARAQGVAVLVDGQPVQFDQQPIMEGGRVLVPMRGVFERLGATVVYVPQTKEIRANRGQTSIDLTLGSPSATINGRPSTLDVPPMSVGGRTVVPLRFISESLGALVRWDPSSRTVSIQLGDAPPAAAQAPPMEDDGDYGMVDGNYQPQYFADQAPPPLPWYAQPPAPGPGYVWTPGYWAWGQMGYYWVPGAWTMAPYVGSLWTPGYWGYSGGRYGWYPGYWGPSVGFYGGVNYGYGYGGSGYAGAEWRNGGLFYNRAYNNVGSLPAANVYVRNAAPASNSHVSFNGGPGGLKAAPTPGERAVLQQPRMPALPAQRNLATQAQGNHANWASQNGGHPAQAAVTAPVGHGQPKAAPRFVPAAAAAPGRTFQPQPGAPTARPAPQANPAMTHPARPVQQAAPAKPVQPSAPPHPTQPPAKPAPAPARPPVQAPPPQHPVTPPTPHPKPTPKPTPKPREDEQR